MAAVYQVLAFWTLMLLTVSFVKSDACANGEIKATGPIAEVHAECSKNLDPTSEANMCEFQCIRKKEDLLDDAGLPSLDKHLIYMKKIMSADLATKAEGPIKECFQKFLPEIQHHEKDTLCDSSKGFNACTKDAIIKICTGS
ncbi:unnamed protein product [Allacma fusca]|uniref:Uncharacterized protein n=1 Tax=Allacma fusca TaxID=39272 RepID=A0A8J2PT20_9HEXA|nr:unnamed protein product [Allacma fusca]